ncbi:MAG: helicase-related protein [Bacillota bacterium]
MSERIPERRPEPVWVHMSPAEWDLYRRVEDYVSHFYRRFEDERKGLGFIMTVYRRRLTSSFAALRRSMERRRAYLLNRAGPAFGLTDEDTEDEDLDEDAVEELEGYAGSDRFGASFRRLVAQEVRELEAILDEAGSLAEDTKFVRLADNLQEMLARRDTVAVFTHYTDTMDDLRARLVGVYGRTLACYSGRGGERWDGRRWVLVPKEEVKNAFRAGDIRVLLCTEAASEGLNLQTCGVLINYDMPWNPMRVEQRIGRFDRIGQTFADVWIRHYFLLGPEGEETVEAKVYRALDDRIDWFRSVVGELGPILARIPRVIERAAVAAPENRQAVLAEALADIRREIEAQAVSVSLDDWAVVQPPSDGTKAPLDLADLERILRTSSLGSRFSPHPEIAGALRLDWGGRTWEVTFDPAIADLHPGRVRLLTYGEALLDELLSAAKEPVETPEGAGIIRARAGTTRRWFAPTAGGGLNAITTLESLQRYLSAPPTSAQRPQVEEAARIAGVAAEEAKSRIDAAEAARSGLRADVLKERARGLIAAAAAAKIASREGEIREALARVARSGYPWAGLVTLAGYPEAAHVEEAWEAYVRDEDSCLSPDELEAQAERLLAALAPLAAAAPTKTNEGAGSPQAIWPSASVLPIN